MDKAPESGFMGAKKQVPSLLHPPLPTSDLVLPLLTSPKCRSGSHICLIIRGMWECAWTQRSACTAFWSGHSCLQGHFVSALADLRVQHQPLQVRVVKATSGTPFLINLDLGPTRSVTSEQGIVCPVHGVQKHTVMPLQPRRMPGASETFR